MKELREYASVKSRQVETAYHLCRLKLWGSNKTYPGVVILGCGRSGTKYVVEKLRANGYDVGHERLKRYGVASWYAVASSRRVPLGPTRDQVLATGFRVLHQVRNPADTIGSAMTFGEKSWRFIEQEIQGVDLRKDMTINAMRYWLEWNKRAAALAEESYQVENLDTEFERLFWQQAFNKVNDEKREKHRQIPKSVNTRKHLAITCEDLKRKDLSLFGEIRSLALAFGYVV